MGKKCPFETLESKKTPMGRFQIVQDSVKVNGNIQSYDYVELPEGVCILPIKDEKIVTLMQYRYPIRGWQRELPGGLIDPGETPEEAAVRELREETGYIVNKIESLDAIHPSFGATNETIYLFAAFCREKGEDDKDAGEVLNLEEMELEDFKKFAASGEFMHAAGLAAWARYIQRECKVL